ncbi:MAG: hypothetical protein R3F34_00745 [Planctomycetota bacterium]
MRAFTGAPSVLAATPPPRAGRPAGYGGAVGRFTATLALVPENGASAVTLGDTVDVELVVVGEDGARPAPSFVAPPGFHVVARDESVDGSRFVGRYAVAPLRVGDIVLPELEFATFVPGEGYGSFRTEALHLEVAPRADGAVPEEIAAAIAEDERRREADAWDTSLDGARRRTAVPPVWSVLAVLVAPWIVALTLVRTRSRRARRDPRVDVARAALGRLEQRLDAGEDPGAVLVDFLDGAPRAAERRRRRLQARAPTRRRGAERDDAERCSALVERLVAARFGGGEVEDARASVLASAQRLDAALDRPAKGFAALAVVVALLLASPLAPVSMLDDGLPPIHRALLGEGVLERDTDGALTLAEPASESARAALDAGVLAAREGRLAEAASLFVLVQRGFPDADAPRTNLARIDERLGLDAAPSPADWRDGVREEHAWTLLGTVLVLETVAAFLVLLAGGRRRREVGAGLALLGAAVGAPLLVALLAGRAPIATVVVDGAALRGAPDPAAARLSALAAGRRLTVLDASTDAVLLRDGDVRGWVASTDVVVAR